MSVEEGVMTWTAYEVYDSFQVVPHDDLKPNSFLHSEYHPEYVDGIFIHKSFNGKEATETPLPS